MTVRELRLGVYDLTCRDDDRECYRAFLFDTDVPTLVYQGSSVPEDAREKLDAFVNYPGKGS